MAPAFMSDGGKEAVDGAVVVMKIRGTYQTARGHGQFLKVMKHKDPFAAPARADLKAGAPIGEGIRAGGPWMGFSRRWVLGIVVPIVEDQFEVPIGCFCPSFIKKEGTTAIHSKPGQAITVVNAFEVSVRAILPIAVDDSITFIVTYFADQPCEDARGVRRIGYPVRREKTIEREDVVSRDRTPVGGAVAIFCPSFNPCEETLDAGPITPNRVPGN